MEEFMEKLVGIIMGSDSDLPVVKGATDILDEFGIGYEVIVSSAHRTPKSTEDFAKGASERGLKVISRNARSGGRKVCRYCQYYLTARKHTDKTATATQTMRIFSKRTCREIRGKLTHFTAI